MLTTRTGGWISRVFEFCLVSDFMNSNDCIMTYQTCYSNYLLVLSDSVSKMQTLFERWDCWALLTIRRLCLRMSTSLSLLAPSFAMADICFLSASMVPSLAFNSLCSESITSSSSSAPHHSLSPTKRTKALLLLHDSFRKILHYLVTKLCIT